MKKQLASLILVASLILGGGCGLIPKKVEFFQDKVHLVPELKQADKEIQRQTAQRAEEKARETYGAAIYTDADPAVVAPAAETVILTDAVSESVGPPVKPASADKTTQALVNELRTSIAKLNQRMDDFKKDNNENAGKKIEGTGFFQVPYFVYLGGFLIVGLIGFVILSVLWSFVKMAGMANPPVQMGVTAAQLSANFLKRSLSEVVKGGEQFKDSLMGAVEDPDLQAKIKELFRIEQERAQSHDTQGLIKTLTKKEH